MHTQTYLGGSALLQFIGAPRESVMIAYREGDEAAKVYLVLCFLQDAAKKIGLIFLLKLCWTWVDFKRVAVIQLHGMNTIYSVKCFSADFE